MDIETELQGQIFQKRIESMSIDELRKLAIQLYKERGMAMKKAEEYHQLVHETAQLNAKHQQYYSHVIANKWGIDIPKPKTILEHIEQSQKGEQS